MNKKNAKRIGSKQGLISAGLGLLIAQLIMTTFVSLDKDFVEAFFWFTSIDYKLNILIGGGIMLFCGHFYGQLASNTILIRKSNSMLIGWLCSMGVLLTTAFLAGWTGFVQEGIYKINTNDDPFVDYIFKPFFWVTIFGTIPALIVGIWFGARVKAKGREPEGIHCMHDRK